MSTVTYNGTGTLLTWSEPNSLQSQVEGFLLSQGWGVTRFRLSNGPSLSSWSILTGGLGAALIPSWNYYITIDVDNSSNANPEVIKQALIQNLSNWFSSVTLNVVNPNAGILDALLGTSSNAGGGPVGGISTTTLLVILAAAFAVMVTVNHRR